MFYGVLINVIGASLVLHGCLADIAFCKDQSEPKISKSHHDLNPTMWNVQDIFMYYNVIHLIFLYQLLFELSCKKTDSRKDRHTHTHTHTQTQMSTL